MEDEKVNILIVDDEQIVLDSIRKHLRNEDDYRLFTALTVDEATQIMGENEIHIILTDLMMPDTDGLEFTRMIKQKDDSKIVIMITGYATINTALQAMQIGAFDYIAKPFTREELRKVVRRAANLVGVSKSAGQESKLFSKEAGGVSDSEIKGIGEHTWIMRQENGDVIMGVERPLLYSMGKIQTLYLPSMGDEIRQGSVYFQIFSADLRSQSLLSPLTGRVVEVNQKIIDDPSRLVEDPYGEGWLIKIEPEKFDEEIKMLGR